MTYDKYGLISPTGEVNQNGVLWSAYYSAATGMIKQDLLKSVESCLWYGLRRTPESTEIESHDNYLGLAFFTSTGMSDKCDSVIEEVIANNGLILDVEGPNDKVRPWYHRYLKRFPHVYIAMKASVGIEPNPLEHIIYKMLIKYICRNFKKGDNAALQVFLMLNILCSDELERFFWMSVKRSHGTLSKCLEDYMQISSEHFLSQAFRGIDGRKFIIY